MSKSKNTKNNYYIFDDEEQFSESKFREEIKRKRKQKRLNNAIKSKNIDDLLNYEED